MLSKKSVVIALWLLGLSFYVPPVLRRLAWCLTLPPWTPLRRRQFGWRAEQAERHGLEVLHDGGEVELVTCAGKAS